MSVLLKLRNSISQRTRRQRRDRFVKLLTGLADPLRILDLGGTLRFWLTWRDDLNHNIRVTAVNNHHIDKVALSDRSDHSDWYDEINMDVRNIAEDEYADYDLIFSNSFLEHLDSYSAQEAVAEKIERSNRPYFIQVPNKYSIIDPHYPSPLVPFFAAYPRRVQTRLVMISAWGSGTREPDLAHAEERTRYYNPLAESDIRTLFPSATHEREKTLGFTRSILAFRVPA